MDMSIFTDKLCVDFFDTFEVSDIMKNLDRHNLSAKELCEIMLLYKIYCSVLDVNEKLSYMHFDNLFPEGAKQRMLNRTKFEDNDKISS